MKAFLLAAGHGTRLRPLTDSIPKCLLPIQGVPMLEIWLRLCRRYHIDEVLLNLHSHADQVRDFLCQGSYGVRVYAIEEPVLLGSAGTLRANQHWIASEEYFWIFYADVLSKINLDSMLNAHLARRPVATLAVSRVSDPKRCGVVEVDSNQTITSFVEKPTLPRSNLAFAGLLVGTPQMLSEIPPHQPADIGFDLLPRLVGRMSAYEVADFLLDVGTMENYHAAQEAWSAA
jgi:mannose-1-phosphate guanylyltransferase